MAQTKFPPFRLLSPLYRQRPPSQFFVGPRRILESRTIVVLELEAKKILFCSDSECSGQVSEINNLNLPESLTLGSTGGRNMGGGKKIDINLFQSVIEIFFRVQLVVDSSLSRCLYFHSYFQYQKTKIFPGLFLSFLGYTQLMFCSFC